jgi:hypothetical protein
VSNHNFFAIGIMLFATCASFLLGGVAAAGFLFFAAGLATGEAVGKR